MQKIVDLLKGIGASDELAKELVEAVQGYAAQVEARERARFEKILEKSKSLCVEYVENEVLKNARKMKVYIEAKEREIAEAIERNRKLEESEAVAQLRKISAVLNHGEDTVNVDALRENAALKKDISRLENAYKALREEKKQLIAATNRSNRLAERALTKAKQYRSALDRVGVLESKTKKQQATRKTVAEARRPAPRAPAAAPSRGGRLIGESRRRSARPATSRPAGVGRRPMQSVDPLVNQVARNMDVDL